MTDDTPKPAPPLQQFELAWRRGENPDVRAFAAEHSTPQRDLLPELVVLNFACLWEYRGDAPPVVVYLNQFHEFRNNQEIVFELLTIEILRWPRPDRDKYLANFPEVSWELDRLFDLLKELRPDKLQELRGSLTQCGTKQQQTDAVEKPADPVIELNSSESIALNDRFKIGDLAGRGGFKRVYLGTQNSTGRRVAVKQLKQTSPNRCRQFVSESRIQAALDHQNIPPVAMLGQHDSTHDSVQPTVLIEKFISAPDWSTSIHARNTSLRENLGILLTVSRTVAFAHGRNIVHRDIKPENVLVDEFGQVYLTDWGLAAQSGDSVARDERISHVRDDKGRVNGSPFYMPPEVALGRMELTEPATDVFQLGAVLYEILAGRGPYGMTPATAWIRAAGHRIRPLPRSVPKEFRAVVARAMAQKASDRYPTAREFEADLQQLIDDEDVSVCRPPLTAWLRRKARRHKTAAASLGAAAVAGLLVATAASVVVAEKNERLTEVGEQLEISYNQVLGLNVDLTAANLELDSTNIQLEETNRTLDQTNRELAAANTSLRKEKERLELALEIGFKLLRGIETDQYHSLDDAYSDIVQNGFRLPDQERAAMLPLYNALLNIQDADTFISEIDLDDGVLSMLRSASSQAAALRALNTGLENLNESVAISEDIGLAWLLRAQLRMELLGHPKGDVLPDWDQAVELLPHCSACFSGRGFCWIGMEKFDTAIKDLTRATKLDPRNEYAHYGLAKIFLARRQYDSAVNHYQSALSLKARYSTNPNWKQNLYEGAAYSYWGRAQSRFSANDPEGAFNDFLIAIRYCPAEGRPALWPNLLTVLARLKPDASHAEQLRKTTSVFDTGMDAFNFTRDCLAELAAARAGTLKSADVERLAELIGKTPTLRAETTEAFLNEFARQAASDDLSPANRELMMNLSRVFRQK